MTAANTPRPPVARPTCACGHDRYHHHVRPDLRHGVWAWLAFFNGISATPKEITFRCSRCGEVFETTRDPAVLRAFRRYPDVQVPEDRRQGTGEVWRAPAP